jgi:hypothetical protein
MWVVSSSAPLLASLPASLFPSIFICALTLYRYSREFLDLMCLRISCNSSLLGWLFWDVGCFNCVFMKRY